MNAPAKNLARMPGKASPPAPQQPASIDYAAVVRRAAAPLRDVRFTERAYVALAGKSSLFSQQEADRASVDWVQGKGRVYTMASLLSVETTFRDVLGRLPDAHELTEPEERIATAIREYATEAHYALFAGVLNDAFRTKSGEESAVYADMLTCTFEFLPEADDDTKPVKGMPVAAIAAAVLELCASQVFRPAISEVVEKARAHRDRLSRALWCIRTMRNAITFGESWLEDLDVKRPFAVDYFDKPDSFDAAINGENDEWPSDAREGRA